MWPQPPGTDRVLEEELQMFTEWFPKWVFQLGTGRPMAAVSYPKEGLWNETGGLGPMGAEQKWAWCKAERRISKEQEEGWGLGAQRAGGVWGALGLSWSDSIHQSFVGILKRLEFVLEVRSHQRALSKESTKSYLHSKKSKSLTSVVRIQCREGCWRGWRRLPVFQVIGGIMVLGNRDKWTGLWDIWWLSWHDGHDINTMLWGKRKMLSMKAY